MSAVNSPHRPTAVTRSAAPDRPMSNGPTATRAAGPSVDRPAPRRPRAAVQALVVKETSTMLRRPGTALVALLLPVVLVGLTFVGGRPDSLGRWGATLGMHVVIALLMTAYLNIAAVVVTRRESLVLKRFRTTELSGRELLGALVTPFVALTVVQLVVMAIVHALTGAPAPRDASLLVLAVTLGVTGSIALAIAVAALTSSAERVQLSTAPAFLAAAVGTQIVTGGFAPTVSAVALLMPLAPVADLVHKAWAGPGAGITQLPGGIDPILADSALLVAWTLVAVVAARSAWRWEPRG